jgi:hypothetical protein
LTSRIVGRNLGMTAEGTAITYLKGLKMRTDLVVRGETLSTIVDLDDQRFVSLSHGNREADVYDMRPAARLLESVADGHMVVEVTPTDRRRDLLGQPCVEHVVRVLMRPSSAAGGDATSPLQGTAWIAPDEPGRSDWARFYRAAAEKGLFFTDPRVAHLDPRRAKGMTLLYSRIADHGVPYVIEIVMTDATGGSTTRTELSKTSLEQVSDEMFVVPAGYRVVKK